MRSVISKAFTRRLYSGCVNLEASPAYSSQIKRNLSLSALRVRLAARRLWIERRKRYAAPPPSGTASITKEEASRFLNQATFGATASEIDRLQAIGYSEWIVDQFSRPQESLLQKVLLVMSGAEAGVTNSAKPSGRARSPARTSSVSASGSRSRQSMVASYSDGNLAEHPVAMANCRIMSAGAFGNLRQTLENITTVWRCHLADLSSELSGRRPRSRS
ncbi:MAG: hypothetical protein R3C58_13005 [Parvularculaceae bacterium]